MVELIIKEINKNNQFILLDNKTEEAYFLFFEFYNVQPELGDKLIISRDLLNRFSPFFAQPYAFDVLDEKSIIGDIKAQDKACLIKNNCKIYLIRVYG